jgi:AmiR/NasT family two-component response regulator
MALRAQLEALDLRVLGPARNGDQAVALGLCYPADVALFDVRMPVRSGIDAAHALFDDAPTPVVLLTGFAVAELPDPVPMPPIFGVLSKPIELAVLQAGLDTAQLRFRRWAERNQRRAEVERAQERRAIIGRAIDQTSDTPRRADAAVRFLQRARDQNTTPVELARAIVTEAR